MKESSCEDATASPQTILTLNAAQGKLDAVDSLVPIYQLTDDIVFPPARFAEPEGLLAVGGDLSAERLLLAYASGIFPWYEEGQPILWWSPDPRLVLFPNEFHCSRRLRRVVKQNVFTVTMDTAFERVIRACSNVPRFGQAGTWITEEMIEAYCDLHRRGYAHSVECWNDESLVGGLYGVSLGGCFFGESMFSLEPNASKVALTVMMDMLTAAEFDLVDCQMNTQHLVSIGAREIARVGFLRLLKGSLRRETRVGKWPFEKPPEAEIT